MRLPATVLLVVVAMAACAGSADATVLLPAEFREIVGGSEIIVYGRVVDAAAEMSVDRKQIDTVVTFEVGTYLKGGHGETLTFRVPGGQIGRFRSVTVGAPTFVPGDEVVLFLRRREDGLPYVFGLNQGVFRVQREARTQRRMVLPPLMARADGPEPVVRGGASRSPMALEAFGAQVSAVIAELAGQAR